MDTSSHHAHAPCRISTIPWPDIVGIYWQTPRNIERPRLWSLPTPTVRPCLPLGSSCLQSHVHPLASMNNSPIKKCHDVRVANLHAVPNDCFWVEEGRVWSRWGVFWYCVFYLDSLMPYLFWSTGNKIKNTNKQSTYGSVHHYWRRKEGSMPSIHGTTIALRSHPGARPIAFALQCA